MKVVLIGANGQLGSDLRRTAPSNVKLFTLTRKELDITLKTEVKTVLENLKPDIVINTSAYVKVDKAEEEIDEAFKVNAIGVKHLSETCEKLKITLLHISTDYVFDGKKGKLKKPYYESDQTNPINIYGISKLAGEMVIKNYLEKFYIIRVASLFGKAGASGKGGNFVYTILNKAKKGEPIKVVNDIFMSPTYTYDAAKEIWNILLEEKPYGIYHVTNKGFCSWYEFAVKILEIANLKVDIKPVKHTEFKMKAKRPLWSPLASKKGVELSSWENALERFLKEIKA